MTRKQKIILSIIIALVLIIAAVLIWWWWPRPVVNPVGLTTGFLPAGGQMLPANPATLNKTIPAELENKPQLAAAIQTIAIIFAERSGSYSNQAYFANLNDLRSLMTIKMQGWTDNFIKTQQASLNSAQYYGITTKVLSTTIKSFDESLGRADVVAVTQRQEAKVTTDNPRVFYQDLLLKLVKVGDDWKIDEATWQ